jgi:glycosyltransferase involved in cell wall biosynthesis
MLTPDIAFLDRRIAQEAASIAARGSQVDIFAVFGPLEAPPTAMSGDVRLIAPRTPASGRGAVEGSARRFKKGLKKTLPFVHDVLDRAQYAVTDRAGAIADAHADEIMDLGPYDLVFAHDIPVVPLAARLRKAWGSPIVCDLHEVYPEMEEAIPSSAARGYWRRVERRAIGKADALMCVNAGVEEYVVSRYRPQVPVEVVLNSVPYLESARLRPGAIHAIYGMPEGTRVLVYAGSLRPANNLEAVVRGFARARLDGWALAFLGTGPLQARIEEFVLEEAATDRVFLGLRVAQDDLVPVLGSADAGLLPYTATGFNHRIATPNKLFEYIQARIPIVSSRLPMVERILDANGNGTYVDFSTPATIADGLRSSVAHGLPTIARDVLEAAAATVCWEHDEVALLRAVDAALASRVS